MHWRPNSVSAVEPNRRPRPAPVRLSRSADLPRCPLRHRSRELSGGAVRMTIFARIAARDDTTTAAQPHPSRSPRQRVESPLVATASQLIATASQLIARASQPVARANRLKAMMIAVAVAGGEDAVAAAAAVAVRATQHLGPKALPPIEVPPATKTHRVARSIAMPPPMPGMTAIVTATAMPFQQHEDQTTNPWMVNQPPGTPAASRARGVTTIRGPVAADDAVAVVAVGGLAQPARQLIVARQPIVARQRIAARQRPIDQPARHLGQTISKTNPCPLPTG